MEYPVAAQPTLKTQDLIVALKLAVSPDQTFTFVRAAFELGLQPSQIHSSVKMLQLSRLGTGRTLQQMEINRERLADVLIYGAPTIFPALIGGIGRGVRTADVEIIAPGEFAQESETAYVWPHASGDVRGQSLTPLHPCVLFAAGNDTKLRDVLVALDICRVGAARERKVARDFIREALV